MSGRRADTPLDAWSRRRALVRAEAEQEKRREHEARAAREQAAIAMRHADKSEDEILDELGLCRPEDMTASDDFSAFMRAGVPAYLRKRALRRLWQADPVLANLDELVDYGEDFTAKAGAVGAVRTAYRIGKGLLAEAEPEQAAKWEHAPEQHAQAGTEDMPQMAEAPVQAVVAPSSGMRDEDEEAADAGRLARPRRMHFFFDEEEQTPSKEEATG